jgi:hypothetical protein
MLHTPDSTQPLPEALVRQIASETSEAVSDDFIVLAEALRLRFGTSLDAILLYGSCLRSARSVMESLIFMLW